MATFDIYGGLEITLKDEDIGKLCKLYETIKERVLELGSNDKRWQTVLDDLGLLMYLILQNNIEGEGDKEAKKQIELWEEELKRFECEYYKKNVIEFKGVK